MKPAGFLRSVFRDFFGRYICPQIMITLYLKQTLVTENGTFNHFSHLALFDHWLIPFPTSFPRIMIRIMITSSWLNIQFSAPPQLGKVCFEPHRSKFNGENPKLFTNAFSQTEGGSSILKFSQMLTVRPLRVSLTVKYPGFFLTTSLRFVS